jgi:DNA-binding GntR family transcriptional regulator
MRTEPPPATRPANMITDHTLDRWEKGTAAQRIAAAIATKIRDGAWEQYQALPATEYIAAQHDVSLRTAGRAKKLLLDAGILGRDGRTWYVA